MHMAAVLRMTQLLSHIFSFTVSLCFHSFSFLSPPYFFFILKLCFCVWLIFLPLVFSLSLSLSSHFPFTLFLCCPVVVPGLGYGRIITCTHNANVLVPILFLLSFVVVIVLMFVLPVILCPSLCFVVTLSGSSVSCTLVSLLLSPLLLLLLW